MAARTIALLLLGFALHTTHSVPVPQCGPALPSPPPCGGLPPPPPQPQPCASAPSAPLAPEVYSQNNGNPLVVYAPSSEPAAPIAPISLPAPPPPSPSPAPCAPAPPSPPPCSAAPPPPCGSAPPAPWPPVPVQPAPCNSAVGPIIAAAPSAPSAPAAPWNAPAAAPSAPAAAVTADDLSQAQALADQSVLENAPLEAAAAPQSDQPCHVETSTEVVQHPGETFVHQPGEILISQPPTRLVINHAPYIVRPSPVVLNQGGKTITNAYTRKILPGQVQYRPIIVRIVKPIERKVLIDKPAGPCGSQSYVSSPPVPNPCDVALAPYQSAPLPPLSAAPQAPASAAYPPSAVALSPSAYGINSAIDASSVLSPAAATAADQASLAALLSQANLSAPSGPAEIQSADGSYLSALPPASPGCGC